MDIRGLIGLGGVLIAAMSSEFNDQVSALALTDIRGGLGISSDPGTWIDSLYLSAEIVGMAIAPWLLVTFSLRRFTLFVAGLCCVSTLLIPFAPGIELIYALRLAQGLGGGLTIPLLMTTALRVLTPDIRLYGLAVYALSATFTPALSEPLAALWTDIVGWRFIFFEVVPLSAVAAAAVWWGLPQDPLRLERFALLDWRGVLLLILGIGSFSTMIFHGDRLDWFNSPLICVLALLSAVGIPLFLLNEWFHPLPLLKLQMLERRNFTYGVLALFLFLLIAQSGATVPLRFLQQVEGYRPIQAFPITLEIALAQLVMLPVLAWLLDFPRVDARLVSFVGLALILAACIGCSFVTVLWNRDQFYPWQALQAVGQPMVVMPLLMIATNTVRSPVEGPFASALVNTPRAIAEVAAIWMLDLITRWRGGLHSSRLVDQIGQTRWRLVVGNPLQPAPGSPGSPAGLEALQRDVARQVDVLVTSDTYLVMAALTVGLMLVLVVLPTRSLPPRLELAK